MDAWLRNENAQLEEESKKKGCACIVWQDFLLSLQKRGRFCVRDTKISVRFQRDFPYKIRYSTVLDSKSAVTKAKTDIFLSLTQKCRDIKKSCHVLAHVFFSPPIYYYYFFVLIQ